MGRVIVVYIFSCILFGCAQDADVLVGTDSVSYRRSIDPIGKVVGMTGDSPAFFSTYADCYLLWQIEHDALVDSLGKSHLAIVESHDKVIGYLSCMESYLEVPRKKRLQQYRQLYGDLLREAKRRAPLRAMNRKYKSLQRAIERQFSPETVR